MDDQFSSKRGFTFSFPASPSNERHGATHTSDMAVSFAVVPIGNASTATCAASKHYRMRGSASSKEAPFWCGSRLRLCKSYANHVVSPRSSAVMIFIGTPLLVFLNLSIC